MPAFPRLPRESHGGIQVNGGVPGVKGVLSVRFGDRNASWPPLSTFHIWPTHAIGAARSLAS